MESAITSADTLLAETMVEMRGDRIAHLYIGCKEEGWAAPVD